MKLVFIPFIVFLLALRQNCGDSFSAEKVSNVLQDGKRTEKEKVIKIALDTARKIYGTLIDRELPLIAKLVGDSVWIVQGTLPPGWLGGTVYVELTKYDLRVVKLIHYK